MSKIAYIDLEFKDKVIDLKRHKQPTEIACAWFSNKKKLNFNHYQFDYHQQLDVVLRELKQIIKQMLEKYNFDTFVFWDSRQDLKILEEAKVDLIKLKIEDLQENIANLSDGNRLSLEVINKLFQLNNLLAQEVKNLKGVDVGKIKLHTAAGDATRIAIVHKKFIANPTNFLNTINKSNQKGVEKTKNKNQTKNSSSKTNNQKTTLKKSILQNLTLTPIQIQSIREGTLLLLALETLSEEERKLEEQMLTDNKSYQLVKKLQEKNYDVQGFTIELLKINRFLKVNFNLNIMDLYKIKIDR